MEFIIKKQDEVRVYKCDNGYIAIESDVSFLGKQTIYLSPENAIALGQSLISISKDLIKFLEKIDIENEENS